MIIDISKDGRYIEWWENGVRKILDLWRLIDAFEAVSKIVDAWNEHEWPEYLEEDVGKILKEANFLHE